MSKQKIHVTAPVHAGFYDWSLQLLLALSYFLLGLVMHRYIVSQGIVSVYWPGSGVALAAVLLGGQRYLWGVLLGSLALNVWTNSSPWLMLGFTVANVLEAYVAAQLLRRYGSATSFLQSLPDYLRFVGLGALACSSAALLGAASLLAAGFITPADFSRVALNWWMGDLLGLVLLTPLLFAWCQTASFKASRRYWLEALFFMGLTLLAGQIIFLGLLSQVFHNFADDHMMFLFMAFVALRLGRRGVTLALLLISVQALMGAYLRIGYFADEIDKANLSNFWAYMLIQSLVSMSFTLNIYSRYQLSKDLRKNQEFIRATLDSLPNEIIVLDQMGTIVSANQSWLRWSDQGRDAVDTRPVNAEVGRNYLDLLGQDASVSPDDSLNAQGGIRGVLDGRLPYFNMEYPFQSAIELRWFAMTVTPLKYQWVGAVVTHTDITERKQLEDQVHQIAFNDPLTQLYNRRAFNDHLGQAMAASKRSACYCALMFLDLDNFKPLNDAHGHGVGDLLLIELANRLKSCVREVDTVARFGGDEFVVLLGELHVNREASAAQARSVAEKIQTSLSAPYLLAFDNQTDSAAAPVSYQCSVSIGVVVFLGHEHSQNNILKLADVAMYQAKVAGRNLIRFYES